MIQDLMLPVPEPPETITTSPPREAARAPHDALSLLTGATSIDVVPVDLVIGDMDHGADPGVDIAMQAIHLPILFSH